MSTNPPKTTPILHLILILCLCALPSPTTPKVFSGKVHEKHLSHTTPSVVGRFITHGSHPTISGEVTLQFNKKFDAKYIPEGLGLYIMLGHQWRSFKKFSTFHHVPRTQLNYQANLKFHRMICNDIATHSTYIKQFALKSAISNSKDKHFKYKYTFSKFEETLEL
jgi:hypothetical protein